MKPWITKLYYMVRTNGHKIIPAHRKYLERDATRNTMEREQAESYVTRIRKRTKLLMAQREADIDAGLEHYSPAVARDIARERGALDHG